MRGITPLVIRFITIIWGGITLLWLSTEDVSTIAPVLAGFVGVCLIVRNWLHPLYAGRSSGIVQQLLIAALTGAVIGAGTILNSVLLMFFKTAWHAHAFPDYPPLMMLAMLERTPAWALAGALSGSAILLFRFSVRGLHRDAFRKAIGTTGVTWQRQDLDHG